MNDIFLNEFFNELFFSKSSTVKSGNIVAFSFTEVLKYQNHFCPYHLAERVLPICRPYGTEGAGGRFFYQYLVPTGQCPKGNRKN